MVRTEELTSLMSVLTRNGFSSQVALKLDMPLVAERAAVLVAPAIHRFLVLLVLMVELS